MISFLSNVAETIILTIIVCTILEMLLPNSKNKKYIKVIMGIYLIFNMISPIINNDKIFATDFQNIISQNESVNSQNASNQNLMDDQLEKIYKKKLNEEIENKIDELGYKVKNIEVDAQLLGENAGIYSIKACVSKKELNKKEDKDNNINENEIEEINEVSEVNISIGNMIKNKIKDGKSKTEEEKTLQKNIAEYYQIDVNAVNISIE